MPTVRKRAMTQEPSATPNPTSDEDPTKTPNISLYELSREERIKENKERLQKLGIVDLSQKFKASIGPKRTPRGNSSGRLAAEKPIKLLPSVPTRRSSRLQNITPVSYTEAPLKKKDVDLKIQEIVLEEGAKPEIYTEEHEKLLGNTEKSWELFVDGYDKDGKRIYDPVRGKTCHQCRQKTLGRRTQCSTCKMVQGQFCGDCLYMRYGEHVLEALENPNWVCPVCRGICNCSLCRQGKGWPATGSLYRKVSSLGYKSVAQYLIQTRRAQNNVEEETPHADSVSRSSVKRSLPFSGTETPSKEPGDLNDDGRGSLKPESDLKAENVEKPAKRSLPFSNKMTEEETEGPIETEETGKGKSEGQQELPSEDNRCNEDVVIIKESCPKPKRKGKPRTVLALDDSIGGRLRQRRRMQNGQDNEIAKEEKLEIDRIVMHIVPPNEEKCIISVIDLAKTSSMASLTAGPEGSLEEKCRSPLIDVA